MSGSEDGDTTRFFKSVTKVTEVTVPDWIKGSVPLKRLSALSPEGALNLIRFAEQPARFIRRIVFLPIVRTILGLVATLIGAFLTLFQGSQPGYSSNEEVWGLLDIPLAAVDWALTFAAIAFSTYIDIAVFVVTNVIPDVPGPIDGLLVTIVFVVEVVASVVIGIRLLRAVADSIPVVSGVETFLFG